MTTPKQFACVLTIKGGSGRYGKPRSDRTAPLQDFLVDNQYFYTLIKQHLRTCSVCDPIAVLEYYLNRRRSIPKFKGATSSGLVRLIDSYQRICTKRGIRIPAALRNEYYWRSGSVDTLLKYENQFSLMECAEALRIVMEFSKSSLTLLTTKSRKFRIVHQIITHARSPVETERELQELSIIADVTLS